MGILMPHERRHRITELDPRQLLACGIRALILDVDNTLTTHDNPTPGPGVMEWLASAKQAGLKMIILSNNHPPRVEPFARILGLDYEAEAKKPLWDGIRRACKRMGVTKDETAMVGDQIFTDILGGRLAGLHCILVDPIEPENTRFFRCKRRLEQPVLRAFERRNTR